MNTKAILGVEQLERRDALNATVSLNNQGLLSIVDDAQGSLLTVSQVTRNNTALVEVYNTTLNSVADFRAADVSSIDFTGSVSGSEFYNQTSLPSVQLAVNRAGTVSVLVGGNTADVLDGSRAAGDVYETLTASGTEIGGAGVSNLFSLGGTHTITGGSGLNEIYSIVGADTINGGTGTGYLLVGAKAKVVASKQESVVTFFQPALATPTMAATLQPDVNGNGILYLTPLSQTAPVTYIVQQLGSQLQVYYSDGTTQQVLRFPLASVQWVAFFGGPNGNTVENLSTVNSVLYGGKGADLLLSGPSRFAVLKGHAGSGDVLIGRAQVNDLSVGAGGGSYLFGNAQGQNVFRPNTAAVNTLETGYHAGDVQVGVPQTVNGAFNVQRSAATAPTPQSADYFFLYQFEQSQKRKS